MEYEYEAEMESTYRASLLKNFKKKISDGLFPFMIVDACNERISHFEEMWSFAKSKGFQVYIAELIVDIPICVKRDTHKRSLRDVEMVRLFRNGCRNYKVI